MKKLTYILGVGLISAGMFSCGGSNSALDIKVEDLETACDFVDAYEQVYSEMVSYIEDGELSDDEKETFQKLDDKIYEIEKVEGDKFEFHLSEFEQCESWNKMIEHIDKLEFYM